MLFYALTLLQARAAVNFFEENGIAESDSILAKSKKTFNETFNDFFNNRVRDGCVVC
jgi:hypothetical protein